MILTQEHVGKIVYKAGLERDLFLVVAVHKVQAWIENRNGHMFTEYVADNWRIEETPGRSSQMSGRLIVLSDRLVVNESEIVRAERSGNYTSVWLRNDSLMQQIWDEDEVVWNRIVGKEEVK